MPKVVLTSRERPVSDAWHLGVINYVTLCKRYVFEREFFSQCFRGVTKNDIEFPEFRSVYSVLTAFL